MFRNLYFQSRTFRNFNFSDCLGTIDPMPERALTRMIRLAYEESPDLIDTLRLTLRAEIAERYLRQVRLPLTQRDFLLEYGSRAQGRNNSSVAVIGSDWLLSSNEMQPMLGTQARAAWRTEAYFDSTLSTAS